MVTVIKPGSDEKAIKSVWKQLQEEPARKKLDAHKYCGIVKFEEDGLTLQKRWRNEWE